MSLTQRFCNAVQALLTSPEPHSLVGIATGHKFAYDTLYRVLQQASFEFSQLVFGYLQHRMDFSKAVLVLDDTFVLRYGAGKLKLKKVKDSARQRYAYGYNVVLLIWTDGSRRIPVGFRLYLSSEKTKFELALEVLTEVQGLNLKPQYVLLDAWYPSAALLNFLDRETQQGGTGGQGDAIPPQVFGQ